MSLHPRLFGTLAPILAVFTLLAHATPARAAAVRVLQSDAHGVTLRVDVPSYRIVPGSGERGQLEAGLDGATGEPGRAALPYAVATLALPPGAHASARVIEGAAAETRAARLVPNGKPVFRGTGDDAVPAIDDVPMIMDGLWPASEVQLGAPFTLRGRRLVAVHVLPFRYSENDGRLVARKSLTVRVDFIGASVGQGVAAPDGHWDPVMRGAILNFDQAQSWRERPALVRRGVTPLPGLHGPAPASAAAFGFDEGREEVRIQSDTTGVYGLRFEDLAAKGFPSGIPVAQVSVHRHEFLEGQVPSYGTIELPIEVDDANSDGVFDAGDEILVFVQSWAERSHASVAQRQWGDGEVIYATYLPGRAGLRMPVRPGQRAGAPTALVSFPTLRRFEQNTGYTRTPPDTNTDQTIWTDILYKTRRDSLPFDVNDLDNTHPVTFTVQWNSTAYVTHVVWAQVRNARNQLTPVIDSLVWSGKANMIRSATVPGVALTEGLSNALLTTGYSQNDPLAYAALNWFDVGWWRYFRALDGRLPCSSGGATGAYQIDAVGFLSNRVRVYDVTDSLAPVRVALDPSQIIYDDGAAEYTASFQDSSGGELRRYVVFDNAKQVAPARISAVVRRQLSEAGHGNYLIVAPQAWVDVANTLADLRRSQGYDVLVAPLEVVNDEFNGGRRSTYALKRFFRHAFQGWGAEFAVLLGDGSEDPQNLLGDSGIDYIPCQKIFGPVSSGTDLEVVPSDTWLVSFETPSLPSMFLGRIPANSHDDLAAVVNKIAKYENLSNEGNWRRKLLLLADDRFSTGSFGALTGSNYCVQPAEYVFRALSDTVQQIVLNQAGMRDMDAEVFDVNYYLRNEPLTITGSPPDTCRPNWSNTQARSHATVTPQIMDRLNEGRLWWNFQGHANQYVLAHEDLYVNRSGEDDKDQLTNVDKPFLFSAFACHANGFAMADEDNFDRRGPCIGEDLIMLPDRGAIASWASTGYEILPSPVERPTHLNTHFADRLFADPPRDPDVGDHGARVVLGEVIGATLIDNYSDSWDISLEQTAGWTYMLLGDPATRISIGSPMIDVAANGVPVTSGEPVRLPTIGDTLRIDADLVSNVELTNLMLQFRNDSTTRVIPPDQYEVTPAFPDTGIGGSGGRHYHLVYRGQLTPATYHYLITTTDRNGLVTTFDVFFKFQTLVRANGIPVISNDPVRSDAQLTLFVASPAAIDPATQLEVRLDGQIVPLRSIVPANADTTSREWLVTLANGTLAAGSHTLETYLTGTRVSTVTLRVSTEERLENLMAFPNPFQDEGTRFSFTYAGTQPCELLIRIYTVSGALIYQTIQHGIEPGYHQIFWDGHDAEGSAIANGLYLYKILAKGATTVTEQGRLIKLRRPHHYDYTDQTAP